MNVPSKPTITETAFGYSVTWPEGIEVVAERVREDRGDLWSEITVRTTRPPSPGRLKWGRLNLMSEQTRKQWSNGLSEREPELDWPGMLDQVAFAVSKASRRGEPAILLRDAPQPADDGYLLDPLVLGRLPTAFFGDGSSGKSLIALTAAISIHSGAPLLGCLPASTHRVAYLDWEMDAWSHRERMEGICRSEGIETPDILYIPCRGAIWDEVPRLMAAFADHGTSFVVVDSVSYACGGVPLVSDEAANRYQNALRQLRVGSISVAHRTKADDGDRYIFGSVMWQNQMRSVWYVRKAQEAGESVLDIAFIHRKANTGPTRSDVGLQVSFGDGTIRIDRNDSSPLAQEGGSATVKMRRLLAGGPMAVKQIAAEIGETEGAVRTAFHRNKARWFSEVWLDGERRIQLRPVSVDAMTEDATDVPF